jgi:hypothetical protein
MCTIMFARRWLMRSPLPWLRYSSASGARQSSANRTIESPSPAMDSVLAHSRIPISLQGHFKTSIGQNDFDGFT